MKGTHTKYVKYIEMRKYCRESCLLFYVVSLEFLVRNFNITCSMFIKQFVY